MNHWILTKSTIQMIVTNLDRNLMTLKSAKNYFSAYGVVIAGRTKEQFIKNLINTINQNQEPKLCD